MYRMIKNGINTPSQSICYKPISINNSYNEVLGTEDIQFFVGPTTVTYDSSGGNPSYNDIAYVLYNGQKRKLSNYTLEM
jgi:hypothetical protein